MRSATTSALKTGGAHLMQRRQPTCRTAAGGWRSVSSAGSRRFPPYRGHWRGSL